MGCRIGMATDVKKRVQELVGEGKVPLRARYKTLENGLTYKEANKKETTLRHKCGPHCDGNSGGAEKPGRVWSIYRIDW